MLRLELFGIQRRCRLLLVLLRLADREAQPMRLAELALLVVFREAVEAVAVQAPVLAVMVVLAELVL